MPIPLNHTGAGVVTITAPASGTYSLVLPTTAGSSGQFLQTDGTGTTTWANPLSTSGNYQINSLGVGTAASGVTGEIVTTGNVKVTQVDPGAAAGPIVELFRDSASPAASDVLGQLLFTGRDSAANSQTYAYIQGGITTATSTAEDGNLQFYTVSAGTVAERMRLIASGSLGIGTTSPQKKLVVSNAGAAGIELDPFTRSAGTGGSLLAYNRSTSGYVRMDYDALEQLFFISGSEKMRIDTAGYVGIGTSSPIRPLTLTSEFSFAISGSTAYINVSDSVGSNGTLKSLNLRGLGTSGTAEVNLSSIILTTSSLVCSGVYGTAVGATNRDVYVDSAGNIGYVTSIRASKTNIQDLTDTSWLYQLNPVSFNYRKKDADGKYTDEIDGDIQYGMIAEDVEKVRPDLCFYDDVDGKQELRGVQYSKLLPVMLKALKDQQAIIDSLTARVAALEAAAIMSQPSKDTP